MSSITVDTQQPPAFASITEIHSWKFGSAPPSGSACVTAIRLSPSNPPPPFRRLRGEFFYLDITLSDGVVVGITATSNGFCVRQGDDSPSVSAHDAAASPALHPSVAACLSASNPRFKSNFARFVTERFKRDPCEMLPSTSLCHNSWLAAAGAKPSVYIDGQLLSDALTLQRDWNEDMFALLSLPSDDFLSHDRNIIKTHAEFMEAAMAVAVAAVEGSLPPLNPHEDPQCHIYIAHNLFASRCVDNFDSAITGTPQEVATFSFGSRDVSGSLAYMQVVPGLNTALSSVFDIRGERVLVQGLVPGLLCADQQSSLEYGRIENLGLDHWNKVRASFARGPRVPLLLLLLLLLLPHAIFITGIPRCHRRSRPHFAH